LQSFCRASFGFWRLTLFLAREKLLGILREYLGKSDLTPGLYSERIELSSTANLPFELRSTAMSIDTTEMAIFERIVLPGKSPQGEQALIALDFSPQDLQRMEELAEKARQGSLSPEEQQEIANYERVGHYLAILQSKGRMSKQSDSDTAS
jgi:hypothetical protein